LNFGVFHMSNIPILTYNRLSSVVVA